jgi:hypothetical protein
LTRSRNSAAIGSHVRTIPYHRPLSWIIVLAAVCPVVSRAQLHYTPYADASYQYDSNVFYASRAPSEPIGNNGPTFSDNLLLTRAGIGATYDSSLSEFYANLEARRFDYDQFTALNHDEYLLNGGLKWQLISLFDGTLDYRRERSAVSFLDFTATQLFLQLQSVSTASVNLQFTPDWRLESQGKINDLDSPRPGYPNLSLREESIDEGLRYLGLSRLSAGFDTIYLDGHFTGDEFVLTPRYHQITAQLAAKYVATGLSSFDGAIGYTNRVQENAGIVSGVTGLLAYERALTAKTTIDLKLSRTINSYVTYGGSELDTSAALQAAWHAARRITLVAGYQWTHSDFPGSNLLDMGPLERLDTYQLSYLSVRYQVLDWLSLQPYGQYQTRQSNIEFDTFNRTLYGLQFEARLDLGPPPKHVAAPNFSVTPF